MVFLSLLDDRAKPKGSRDPLGFELVWSYFGRKVIGNLTTITSSMDNFAVAVLGFHWANQYVPIEGDEIERHKKIRTAFLRYEQLIAYIRYYGDATDIMGITRVKKRIHDDKFKLTLGLTADQQILSDQASYGLWGLYSAASRDTGLVSGNNREVEVLGQSLALNIINQLGESWNDITSLLITNKALDKGQLEDLADDFMEAIHHKSVQQPLLEALMSGKDNENTQNMQKELWSITKKIFSKKTKSPENIGDFIDMVLNHKPSNSLKQSLHDIENIERLLVAANNIFHYCRRKNGEKIDEILEKVEDHYIYGFLPEKLPAGDFPRHDKMSSILSAFHRNDMSLVIKELLDLNKEVMQQRSGAPWVEIEADNTLRVKVKSETAELRSQGNIESSWDYDYFIGSFIKISILQLGRI